MTILPNTASDRYNIMDNFNDLCTTYKNGFDRFSIIILRAYWHSNQQPTIDLGQQARIFFHKFHLQHKRIYQRPTVFITVLYWLLLFYSNDNYIRFQPFITKTLLTKNSLLVFASQKDMAISPNKQRKRSSSKDTRTRQDNVQHYVDEMKARSKEKTAARQKEKEEKDKAKRAEVARQHRE